MERLQLGPKAVPDRLNLAALAGRGAYLVEQTLEVARAEAACWTGVRGFGCLGLCRGVGPSGDPQDRQRRDEQEPRSPAGTGSRGVGVGGFSVGAHELSPFVASVN